MTRSSKRYAGTFLGVDDDLLRARRAEVLDHPRWYPEPEWLRSDAVSAADLLNDDAVFGGVVGTLDAFGAVEIDLDRPLTAEEFVFFGALLGRPMPETAPDVRPYVERDVVLNLVAEHGIIADTGLQPFSETALTLHTESSGKPTRDQPRHLVFQCLRAPEPDHGAQTLVVSGTRVHDVLDGAQRDVLEHCRYDADPAGPPILRELSGRPCFSFRDFADQPLRWVHDATDEVDHERVNSAFRALTAALYDVDAVRGIHWRPNTVLVLDNTFGFHGRSAGVGGRTPAERRHLMRLRILVS
ncbi:TauD/TfdA family dioxygenase [Umezawaea sp. Da 62-37]|uniref:TauD/TfdA family dioxygenase n=1 Tax=Umezawaea sp. Da 62-37 TaxID=3075927 RepID=UPI0028F6D667|nr:TauD/TfdA family dioxygenase [Umezawaea sp. Da 62-37]WNV84990.1 TauD/TfdA family dioxygenase [Umezawaea sp. Da 62-37]